MFIQHIQEIILKLTILSFLHYPFIEGYCLENVALGKPATQSNVDYKGYASKAVDGNGDQNYWSYSCTYAYLNRPFWQVDLQAEYTIRAVTITNRADSKVWRLDDFDVEIYTSNPLTDQNATYEKCMTFPGAFGAVTRTVFCDHLIKGRYVRIQKNNNVVLTLCEVAVHPVFEDQRDNCDTGQKRPADFIPHNEVYMRTSGFKKFSGSLMSCMVECFWLPVCDGFNFNGNGHGVGLCELFPVGLGKPMAKPGWTYYEAVCN